MNVQTIIKGKLINVTSKPYSFNGNTGISTKALITIDDNVITLKVDKSVSSLFENAKTFEDYDFTLDFNIFSSSVSVKLINLKGVK